MSHPYLIIEFKKVMDQRGFFKDTQSLAYLLSAAVESEIPVMLLATDLVENWFLYWITSNQNDRYVVKFESTRNPQPQAIFWLIRQAALASLTYANWQVHGLRLAPDPRSEGGNSPQDNNYRGNGFRRNVPAPPSGWASGGSSILGPGRTSGGRSNTGAGSRDAVHEACEIFGGDPFYDEVVEEIERTALPLEDYEGTKEEYEKEKRWLINSTYYYWIFNFAEKHANETTEELVEHYREEEREEEDAACIREQEHKQLSGDRVRLLMQSCDFNTLGKNAHIAPNPIETRAPQRAE